MVCGYKVRLFSAYLIARVFGYKVRLFSAYLIATVCNCICKLLRLFAAILIVWLKCKKCHFSYRVRGRSHVKMYVERSAFKRTALKGLLSGSA
jgi:hypothetical protein